MNRPSLMNCFLCSRMALGVTQRGMRDRDVFERRSLRRLPPKGWLSSTRTFCAMLNFKPKENTPAFAEIRGGLDRMTASEMLETNLGRGAQRLPVNRWPEWGVFLMDCLPERNSREGG